MFKNYLKISLRTLRRQKDYTLINVLGLGLGIACSLLILLFVRDEWTHDAFHEKADSIYRVNMAWKSDGALQRWADTPVPLAPVLAEAFPEIEHATRYYLAFTAARHERMTEYEMLSFVDADFFRMFSFPFLHGTPQAAFPNPTSVVITQGVAEQFYGGTDVVGRVLLVKMETGFEPFTVTGVVADPPQNSSLRFRVLLPIERIEEVGYGAGSLTNWHSQSATFIQLRTGAEGAALAAKLPALIKRHGEAITAGREDLTLSLQPLHDIYFDQSLNTRGLTQTSDPAYSYLLLGIAILVLFIACVNYMALAVAQSARRLKEVGVRKVLGAARVRLARQFIGEALITTFFALLLGVALAELILPTFNQLIGRTLAIDYVARPSTLVLLAGLILGVGLVAGSYPAFYLSRLRPAFILQDRVAVRGRNGLIRLLVLAQFTFSVALLIGTVVMSRQLGFMEAYDLGMDPEDVVIVQPDYTSGQTHARLYGLVQAEMAGQAGVRRVARSSGMISRSYGTFEVEDNGLEVTGNAWGVTPGYLDVLGLTVRDGTVFGEEDAGDVLVNEAFVRAAGWEPETAVGRILDMGAGLRVVGVVGDFHFHSLRSRIRPLMLSPMASDAPGGYLMVKLDPEHRAAVLDLLRAKWTEAAPDVPFQYYFLDEELKASYSDTAMWRKTFGYAAGVAILIACLGLFGLSALMVVRRTKEIGIRKVMGASVFDVVVLVAKGFVGLVGLAACIAFPISYAVMRGWLDDFAYRIDLGPGVFLQVGGAVLALALLTVSYQAVRAALADPVKSLRYE